MRRINYTGRKRINKSDVLIEIKKMEGNGLPFEATIDLSQIDLPEDAPVYLEAYQQTKLERFDFGTVKETGPKGETILRSFKEDEGIKFTVKVVDLSDKHGRLLAIGRAIRPYSNDEGNQKALLPVSFEELDKLVYEIRFSEDSPELVLNSEFEDLGIKSMPLTGYFSALCFPSILKEILIKTIVIDEKYEPDEEDRSDWHTKWVKFAMQFNSEEIPKDDEDTEGRLEWIDVVIDSWADQQKIVKKFGAFLEELQ